MIREKRIIVKGAVPTNDSGSMCVEFYLDGKSYGYVDIMKSDSVLEFTIKTALTEHEWYAKRSKEIVDKGVTEGGEVHVRYRPGACEPEQSRGHWWKRGGNEDFD